MVDYLASMTDRYFMALYRLLFPESKQHIIAQGYCADLEPKPGKRRVPLSGFLGQRDSPFVPVFATET